VSAHEWIIVAVSVFGVVGQLLVAAKRKGADDQKLKQHGDSILQLEDDVKDHGERISRIEGRLEVRHGSH
jgi:hypothetical protein